MFPPIYVTTVLAGERSGSLGEVIERFITYQKLALSVRKKLLVSLLYPAVLVMLVVCLIVFLVTYVVPNFAQLYSSMNARIARADADSDRDRHHGAELRAAGIRGVDRRRLRVPMVGADASAAAKLVDRFLLKLPVAGEVWLKYQVAQFSRVLGTLLIGGIPLLQALDTAADSLGDASLEEGAAYRP